MHVVFTELGVSVRNKAGVPVISILPMQDVRVHLAGVQFLFKIKFFQTMTDSDSSSDECAGLKRASSVKKTEPTFKTVPEKKNFKFEITTGDRVDKFLYKLKKETPLPYKAILEGIESKLVNVKNVTLCSIIRVRDQFFWQFEAFSARISWS